MAHELTTQEKFYLKFTTGELIEELTNCTGLANIAQAISYIRVETGEEFQVQVLVARRRTDFINLFEAKKTPLD